jgi:hypothetical protein
VKAALDTTLAAGGTTSFTIGPVDGLAAGTYSATVTISDTNISADYVFSIEFTVTPVLTFTHSPAYDIPASTVGKAITSINVSGGVSGGMVLYTFSATGLPAGINISPAGVISGTPTTAGAAGTATITVTDFAGTTASIVIDYGEVSTPTHPPDKDYYIKATAVSGAFISPSGNVSVRGGTGITFSFSAASVTVDDKPLSQADVDKGYYTFTDVRANHTISASGAGTKTVSLIIDLSGGNGHVEYKVNNSSFAQYTGPISIPEGSSVVLRAVADDGYVFKEWITPSGTYDTSEISINNVTSPLSFSLYFEEGSDGGSDGGFPLWIPLVVLVIIIAGIAAVFILKKW